MYYMLLSTTLVTNDDVNKLIWLNTRDALAALFSMKSPTKYASIFTNALRMFFNPVVYLVSTITLNKSTLRVNTALQQIHELNALSMMQQGN